MGDVFECDECGADVKDDDLFCPKCNTEFEPVKKVKPKVKEKPRLLVVLDKREPDNIALAFMKQDVDVDFEMLETDGVDEFGNTMKIQLGDIKIGNVHVERCTFSDFVSKVKSGRIYNQIADMKTLTKAALLCIHESPRGESQLDVKDAAIVFKHSQTLNFVLPTFVFPSNPLSGGGAISGLDLMVDFLIDKSEYFTTEKYLTWFQRPTRLSNNKDPRIDVLCGFPGISNKRAEMLLSTFGTLWQTLENIPKWSDVHGIGDKTVDKVLRIWEARNEH